MMRLTLFITGIIVLAVCLIHPFHFFEQAYPFSAHMLWHTSLQLLAAPLLALAIPAENPFKNMLTGLSVTAVKFPLLNWLAGVGVMWIWHIPAIYNAMPMAGMSGVNGHAAGLNIISVLHPLSLLAGGFIFCWPVVTPYSTWRLAPLVAVLYLATACVFCSLLGLLIAFAPAGIYPHVMAADRQIGGLIMWVPCCLTYLMACMYLLITWFSIKGEMA